MTPDSPKGPESETRPALWKRIMEATAAVHGLSLATRVYLVDQVFPLVNAHANRILQYGAFGDRDAVEAISAAVSEVERLTAEVERLMLSEIDANSRLGRAVMRAENAEAEVSRLREQLATQALPNDGSIAELIYEHVKPVPDHEHSSDWTLSRLSVNAAEQAILALAAPVSESVPATPEQDEGRPSGSERLAPRSDVELLRRLRTFVADLQGNTRTGQEKGLPNQISYDDGFSDGQVQAGNDLEMLLDEFDRSAAQAARSEATPEELPEVWTEDETVIPDDGVEYVPSSPPSGGDSDTTPRVWRDRDGDHWREEPDGQLSLVWFKGLNTPCEGGPTTRERVERYAGPLTEVLPSPSSLPQEGGTDEG